MLAILLSAVIGSGVTAPQACACSCKPYDSPEEAVRNFDAIFVGVATSEERDGSRYEYEVDVSGVYTGDVGATVLVTTATEGTACGKSITVGDEYLFFGSPVSSGKSATFAVSSCGPASLLNFDARAVTKQLYGEPKPPDPAAPRISSAPDPGATSVSAPSGNRSGRLIAIVGLATLAACCAVGAFFELRSRRRSR